METEGEVTVILKNVSNGYGTLKNVHEFLNMTLFKSLSVVKKV